MSDPKRYYLDDYGVLIEHPCGEYVLYEDYAQLKAENERLRKAGDAMERQYFDLYWSNHAESTSRYEPKSITDWTAAKDGKPTE